MTLIVVTALLFAIAIGSYIWGAYQLAQFAFRIDQTKGLLVLLVPPYTFYFAIKELNESGKETPTAAAAFGLLATILLAIIFWTPITLVATGQMDKLTPPSEDVAESLEGDEKGKKQAEENDEAESESDSADDSSDESSDDKEDSEDKDDDSDESEGDKESEGKEESEGNE